MHWSDLTVTLKSCNILKSIVITDYQLTAKQRIQTHTIDIVKVNNSYNEVKVYRDLKQNSDQLTEVSLQLFH